MLYLVFLLISSILVIGSSSSRHKPCCTNVTLNTTEVLDLFYGNIGRIPIPSIEYGDKSAGEFKNAFAKAVAEWGFHLMINFQDGAIDAAERLIDDIEEDYHKLIWLIKSKHFHYKKPDDSVESALKNLTNTVQRFLAMEPGKSIFEVPKFTVPEEQINIVNITEKRSAEEMFSENESTVFGVTMQIYAYITHMYLSATRSGMIVYQIIRTSLYDGILNCRVLGNYTQIVEEVFDHCWLIERHVYPETWNDFADAGKRVITTSVNYCKSLENDDD